MATTTLDYKGVLFKKQNEPFSFEQTILSDSFIPLNFLGSNISSKLINRDTKGITVLANELINENTILISSIGLDKGVYYTDVKIIFNDGTEKYTDVLAIVVKPTITI